MKRKIQKNSIKQYSKAASNRICKECMFRIAREGSSRCAECAADYHNKVKKENVR